MEKTALFGLILTGGRSSRMGQDKGTLVYHQTDQYHHLYDLLNRFCVRTFFSCREDQKDIRETGYDCIPDSVDCGGPFNGILSAHTAFPEANWLIVAVDLPFITEETLSRLIENRDAEKTATVYQNESGWPEPLVGIWEAKGLAIALKEVLATGINSPREFLRNHTTKMISSRHPLEMFNANTKEEYAFALNTLRSLPEISDKENLRRNS